MRSMKPNRPILKCFAIVLLLTFSQKLGAGLYLHNWFHYKNFQQLPHSAGGNVASYSCNCVDDFSMPFADPVCETGSIAPVPKQSFVSTFIQPVPIAVRVFKSLRGPPLFA